MALTQEQRWQTQRLPVPGGDELGIRYAISGAIENLFVPHLLTQQQRWQSHRLPIPGGDELGQRYAHSGAIENLVTSGVLTQAQRWQAGYRLPIPDGDVDTIGDRYALSGLIQSLETSGAVVELWYTEWFIDPTWTALELPQHNTGNVFAEIQSFSACWSGSFIQVLVPDVIISRIQFSVASKNTDIFGQADTTHVTPGSQSLSVAQSSNSTQISVASKRTQIAVGISGIIINGN